ncbi:hypothetical protein BDW60DRAFT_199767 [Aspergillus nidulans var. acristatus]
MKWVLVCSRSGLWAPCYACISRLLLFCLGWDSVRAGRVGKGMSRRSRRWRREPVASWTEAALTDLSIYYVERIEVEDWVMSRHGLVCSFIPLS